jgi:acyl dehydratase
MTMADRTRPPRTDRYLEDYVPGDVYECGQMSVSREEIIDFAQRWDPQPMHVDPEAAALGRFGGLIASGWHTVVIAMRLYVDHYLSAVASLASPGTDEIRWPHPVRPGDTIRVRVKVMEVVPSRRGDRGVVRAALEALNQDDELVLTASMNSIVGRRPSSAAL